MKAKNYFEHNWDDVVKYAEDSPSKLVWIKSGNIAGSRNYKQHKGVKSPSGWRLEYKQSAYYCHRIIAIICIGLDDNEVAINHIDCNPFNNLIDNLEICTHPENMRKRKTHISTEHPMSNNTSGVLGVSLQKDYYRAYWTDCFSGKIEGVSFSKYRFGDGCINLAIFCRNFAIYQMNLDGANYSESSADYLEYLPPTHLLRECAKFKTNSQENVWVLMKDMSIDDLVKTREKYASSEDIMSILNTEVSWREQN